MQITNKNYNQILQEITNYIQEAKITMSWNIGKLLFDNQLSPQTITKPETDLKISAKTFYRMLNFYKAYPDAIPKSNLNWTQYSVLSEVKDVEFRNMLEEKTAREALTVEETKQEIKDAKVAAQDEKVVAPAEEVKPTKLIPSRGKLYNYKLGKPYSGGEICLDLGFFVFRGMALSNASKEIGSFQDNENIVEIVKSKNGEYFAKKTEITGRSIHTCKGFLTRIVDGDTIRVSIDLGFEIFGEEILRLRGVYASELRTIDGENAKKYLEKTLRNVEFVVLRTYAVDIYGRYVCDVFYDEKETEAQKIADSGKYLNQELVAYLSNS